MEEQSKVNNIVGNVVGGIGAELDKESYAAVTALENVYVKLETVTNNAAKNSEKLNKKRHERELKNLKNALDLRFITEQEYYEKLKKYRDENFEYGTESWYKLTDDIVAYNSKLIKETEKNNKEREELQKKTIQNQLELQEKAIKYKNEYEADIDETRTKMADKINNLRLGLIEEVEALKEGFLKEVNGIRDALVGKLKNVENDWVDSKTIRFRNINDNGTDLVYQSNKINDFKKESDILERFRNVVLGLKQTGFLPDEFFADVAEMDVGKAVSILEKIYASGTEGIKKFAEGYKKKNALAETIGEELHGVLNKEALEAAKDNAEKALGKIIGSGEAAKNAFVQELEKKFSDVPEGYYKLGEDSAIAFGDGFENELDGIMTDAKDALKNMLVDFAEDFSLNVEGFKNDISRNTSNVYNNTYTFNSSKDTTTAQLAAAKAASTLDKLRGVN